jgi:glycosyltransferase involved in cell wall biosynthesis
VSRPLVSVVIPTRNEQFLQPTVIDALEHSREQIEVIACLDGYWPPAEEFVADPRVRYLHTGQRRGMRAAINQGVAVAKGEFIFKADGHIMFGQDFDAILAADCEKDWVVVPRRKRLDPENWCELDVGKPDIDYMFLTYPSDKQAWGGKGLNGYVWDELNKNRDLKAVEIDDLMSSQGSGWFMRRDYFHWLELMDESCYGTFWNEFQEIGLKTWLSGGRVIVNKRTFYCHLHKGKKYGRGYTLTESSLRHGATYTRRWMTEPVGGAWHKATMPLTDHIEFFWAKHGGVPTWPEDRSLWTPEYASALFARVDAGNDEKAAA